MLGVELAGQDVIVRAVSSMPGYEYRTVWSWDSHQKTMLPTSEEIVRSTDALPAKPAEPPKPAQPHPAARPPRPSPVASA